MPEVSASEMESVLKNAGLEKAGDGVIFPWGCKIVEINGKKFLQPLTPDEYKELVESETGKILTDEEVRDPKCSYVGGASCISTGCSAVGGRCVIFRGTQGFSCVCNY